MTSVIIIQENSLQSIYDQSLDYLYSKYHSHPSYSPDVYVDENLSSEMGYFERMAQNIVEHNSFPQDIPLGKLIV